MFRLLSTRLACLLLLLSGASSLQADDLLMFGPSLAVYTQSHIGCLAGARGHHPEHDASRGSFSEDESHFAVDAGHNVTIVSAAEWASMTTEDFASYDAIVIGDAGCDCDEGDLLEPLNDNKEVWSPAVTGHLFMHTFDPVFHYNFDAPRGLNPGQVQAMVDLSVDGIEYAASAEGTGLYYAHSCRDFEQNDRGGLGALPFLSELAEVVPSYQGGGDDVEILEPGHPSMGNLSDEVLSEWGSSFHDYFLSYDGFFSLLAYGRDSAIDGMFRRGLVGGGLLEGDIIIATEEPLGGASSVLPIPTAQPATLAALALLLAALGAFVLNRRG